MTEAFDIKKELSEAYADPVYFLKFFLPHWFPDKIPWFHRGIIAILTRKTDFLRKYGDVDLIVKHFVWKEDPWDEASPAHPIFAVEPDGSISMTIVKHSLILMPRGFSKTTLLNGLILYFIAYREQPFIAYISETSNHSEMQLGNIKAELTENPAFVAAFGQLKPDRNSDKKWREDFFETNNGVSVIARGADSQIRGLIRRGKRPSLILCDDMEEDDKVDNPEQRRKVRNRFMRRVIPALSLRDRKAFMAVLGTLLHSDALVVTVSRDPRFNSVIFSAVLPDGTALWEEQMSLEALEVTKQAMAKAGDLEGYYLEYHNKIRTDETSKFRQSMFHYNPEVGNEPHIIRALAIDPAISKQKKACRCVIAVVERNLLNGKTKVMDIWGKIGASAREMIDNYFELSKRWNCALHGVETVAFQAVLVHLLREEMYRKNHYFEITEILHSGLEKKEARIHGVLQPRYANGYVEHRIRFVELETQLLDFPNGGLDDADAVAMAMTLLDPYAAAVADPTVDLGADEYEPMNIVSAV
jgi:hypothetical protein